MRPIDAAQDVSGQPLAKGDTVVTVSGDMTGRIYDLAAEDDTSFVRIRPLHMPYGKGVWYAADRLVRVAIARRNSDSNGGESRAAKPAPALLPAPVAPAARPRSRPVRKK